MIIPTLHWDRAEVVAWERQPPAGKDRFPERFEVAVPALGAGLGWLLTALSLRTGQEAGIADLQGRTTVQADGSYLLWISGYPDATADEPVTPDNVLAVLQRELDRCSGE